MWYNIIPSFAIVTGVLAFPALAMAGIHKLGYDNIYERDLQFPHQRCMFLRDERISGSPYKMVVAAALALQESQERRLACRIPSARTATTLFPPSHVTLLQHNSYGTAPAGRRQLKLLQMKTA
ncbi:hypothetical protein GWK47_009498 [Chionoecetes opilio]|uniref:NADH dehydrogenase [ubiquinone] 1 alpha subcomplex subunit 1 n=1 Tax=Chionoecetes opilio TaxID=41210 RepID=A0A8J4XYJ2_CHIOP|nr:hypothetical protein GWK47_009498 [Chionoecetes opilio]